MRSRSAQIGYQQIAKFDPRSPKDLSRNTVSHGVAPVEKFSLKSSLIGLLILDQLFYYMRPQAKT